MYRKGHKKAAVGVVNGNGVNRWRKPLTRTTVVACSIALLMVFIAGGVAVAWVSETCPFSDGHIWSVSACDANHAWAVGGQGSVEIMSYDGTSWSKMTNAPASAGLEGVFALDPSHVWAVGSWGEIFFFDGSNWNKQFDGSGTINLSAVSATDENNVWAVGQGNNADILYYDGNTWTEQKHYNVSLHDVYALDANHVWAVGEKGSIYFFDGNDWSKQNSNTSNRLQGVYAADANHVWASGGTGTGGSGTILFNDGTSWKLQESPEWHLYGIAGADDTHVWAVGEFGIIVFYDGSSWSEEYSGTNQTLLSVTAPDPEHAWAVGICCTVVSYVPNMKSFYFAEGTTREGFDEWLCIQNPGEDPIEVNATYMLFGSEPIEKKYQVGPTSRVSINVEGEVGPGRDVSVHLWSDSDFVAERPMYFDYKAGQPGFSWTGGHCSTGANEPRTDWYFAEGTTREGFEEWICIQNPNDSDETVTVNYISSGAYTQSKDYVVKARSRQSVFVNGDVGPGQDVSVHVQSNNPVVTERPMYFNYDGIWSGGHTVMGADSPRTTWYFAEGTTRSGFKEYLAVQNPGNFEANITVHFLKADGSRLAADYVVGANSRWTVDVSEPLGMEVDSSVVVESDQPIVAERPMYFNYNGVWPGGHDVVGTAAPKKSWFFAEGCTLDGFDEYICIGNPGTDTSQVTLTFMLETGESVVHSLGVNPGQRATVKVSDFVESGHDVSTTLQATRPIVAERPMYFNYNGVWPGGHDVIGF